jgi:hypothetical protein
MATPVAFWVDRLYQHCLMNWPGYISGRYMDSGGGSIELLCEVSSAYCAWWDRYIIEVTGKTDSDIDPARHAVLVAMNQISTDPITEWETPAIPSVTAALIAPLSTEAQKQNDDAIKNERNAALKTLKDRARAKGIRVTDAMVAKAAKNTWNDRTMVTWWKRNDPQCKPSHDKLIRAVLGKDPASIWPSK